jgi:hypothetical protein
MLGGKGIEFKPLTNAIDTPPGTADQQRQPQWRGFLSDVALNPGTSGGCDWPLYLLRPMIVVIRIIDKIDGSPIA